MSHLVEPFDPLSVNPEQGPGQLPVGKHPVVVTGVDVQATKSNSNNGMLILMLQIIDGPCKGSTGPYRLNYFHSNPQTVEIAKRQLSALCHVMQRFQLGQNGTDLSPLFGVPFIVDVQQQVGDDRYTEIKAVFDINGNPPKAQGGAPAQQQAPANTGFQQPAQQPQNNFGGNPAGNFQAPAHTAAAPENTNSFQSGNAFAAPAQQNNAGWQAPASNNFGGGNGAPAGGGKPAWAK